MRRIKIGTVILVYTVLLTLLFAGILGWIQYSAANPTVSDPYVGAYLLTPQEIMKQKVDDPIITPGKIVDTDALREQYITFFLKNLSVPVIGFGLFLLISSFLLWIILKRIQQKDTLQIARSLHHVTEDYIVADPVLEEAYINIHEHFDQMLEDYKRLNSYLSHEQKNAVSILQTRLEADGQFGYLQDLRHITDSINDILTLSDHSDRADTGDVDTVMICAQVCDTYRRIYKDISFDFDEAAEAVIQAKSRWIERAVSNLIDNAVKYGGGKPVEVKVSSSHHSVILTVRDYGQGIPDEKQDAVFHYHYRINELKKDGYGIGLSLVSHVCDLCGGFVTFESEVKKGTCFYLSFPQKKLQM